MKKLFVLLLFFIALGILLAGKFYFWSVAEGPGEEEVHVVIPKGANFNLVAAKLEENGVIDKQWLLKIAARILGSDKTLKAGEYLFEPKVSILDVLKKISSGDIYYRRLTLPEGLTTTQMLDLIAAEAGLSGEISLLPKEGDLLPETYTFSFGDSRDSMVLQAMQAMEKVKKEAWTSRAENLPIKSPEEMMVLASVIEKETGLPEERGLVAAVFVNRLQKGMKLQTDPSVIYALTMGKKELGRSLTRKDLEVDSPYNTYKYYGLPPMPICNPGKDSIMAAVHPEESKYLYFVASGNGGHNFATSLAEHNLNVKRWIKSKAKK